MQITTQHYRMPALNETGFVILKDIAKPIPDEEFMGLEYMDWKSGGDTNFAPIASALGEMECAGFWDHGKPDKDGVWTENALKCPGIVDWVENVGANFGRVRTIKLNPQSVPEAMETLHLDDNNRLNPQGSGWVVRSWIELTNNPGAQMILREDKDDPSTETRIDLRKGMQYVVDTERLWHVVANPSDQPRYALISSFESGPDLENFIATQVS